MPSSFRKVRDLLFKLTALTLVVVAITKAFTPSPKKRKRPTKRPKGMHDSWLRKSIAALNDLSPTLDGVHSYVNSASAGESESESEDEDEDEDESRSRSQQRKRRRITSSANITTSPKRGSSQVSISTRQPRRSAKKSQTISASVIPSPSVLATSDVNAAKDRASLLGDVATGAYQFVIGDTVQFLDSGVVKEGAITEIKGLNAIIDGATKINVSNLWLMFDGTTYGSLQVQDIFRDLVDSLDGPPSVDLCEGKLVLVEGETGDRLDRELWAGIVIRENSKSVEIQFMRQVITELYSETSQLNLSRDIIYFTSYEANFFTKEWRTSTLPKDSVLFVCDQAAHLTETDVGQQASTVYKWL